MKYGVLYNKNNLNIGDDIQAFATARFLPQIDYFIDREHIDEFKPETEEPVAVIMNAWYMWAKWNWPPSKYIVPKMIGFHYADHQLARQPGSPIKYEFLTGLGGDYLKAYGPVGCRDYFTRDRLNEIGVDAYFSGCITMTLPKMPERENKGDYICLVDLERRVMKKIVPLLEEKGIEVKVMTHNRKRDSEMSWEERCEMVKDMLTTYQNARCVVTKRLHCSLPCLAMDVPVYLIKEMEDDIRFEPYNDLLHRTTVTNFLHDNYEYDFLNPPPNKPEAKKYREELIKACESFVDEVKNETRGVDELVKTTYTEADVREWRHDTMKEAMSTWLAFSRDYQIERKKLWKLEMKEAKQITKLKKKLDIEREKVKILKEGSEDSEGLEDSALASLHTKLEMEQLEKEVESLKKKNKKLSKKNKELEKEKERILSSSTSSLIKFIFRRKFKHDKTL
ncbi:MAG: polysaccharide pyruvyl transferase family protein [Ruminococcus sp.]|nr:polysaccharide pyruvyl transferase family protein [Ruminococcus sp.]